MLGYRKFWNTKRSMMVFELLFKHRTIVYVIGTFSKMASTRSQKWLAIFCQNTQNFVYFVPCDFVQISTACSSNTDQIMYGETLEFQCQRQ